MSEIAENRSGGDAADSKTRKPSTALAASLYEVALTGSVAALDALLERHGKVILHRVSLTSFAETPLHLAALMGHLEFSKRLLGLRPELASEQDSEKCTPLHLATANGHDQIIRELLNAFGLACLVQDQEGRVPLHLAAMRGRVPAVQELLSSTYGQQSVKKKAGDGDSVLHLSVRYNHLDILKLVLGSISDHGEVLKMTDSLGNTVLHLAVMLKQIETVRFLIDLTRVRTELINTPNNMNFTVLDVLNQSLGDFKSLEIREILAAAGDRGENVPRPSSTLGANKKDGDGALEVPLKAQPRAPESWKAQVWNLVMQIVEYRGDWMNETKGSLMMVASIIATVTFQAAIAPPGGVWQSDYIGHTDGHPCKGTCYAGEAVLGYYITGEFLSFMDHNMFSFIGSVTVLFLLISGFPLTNKFCLWILSAVMSITVTFLGATFLEAQGLVLPDALTDHYLTKITVITKVWWAVVSIAGLGLLLRLSYWLQSQRYKAAWRRLLRLGPCLLMTCSRSSRAPENSPGMNL